jgi:hypothetical protein
MYTLSVNDDLVGDVMDEMAGSINADDAAIGVQELSLIDLEALLSGVASSMMDTLSLDEVLQRSAK